MEQINIWKLFEERNNLSKLWYTLYGPVPDEKNRVSNLKYYKSINPIITTSPQICP